MDSTGKHPRPKDLKFARSLLIPKRGSVFEYVYTRKTYGSWNRWDTMVTATEISENTQVKMWFNSLFATYKSPVCHIILERTGIGAPFLEVLFSTRSIFLPVNRMEKPKSQINNMCEPETMNGNRFIEQYKWTIGMCITVQIGERGNFTDVQIGERGKQRVKSRHALFIKHM